MSDETVFSNSNVIDLGVSSPIVPIQGPSVDVLVADLPMQDSIIDIGHTAEAQTTDLVESQKDSSAGQAGDKSNSADSSGSKITQMLKQSSLYLNEDPWMEAFPPSEIRRRKHPLGSSDVESSKEQVLNDSPKQTATQPPSLSVPEQSQTHDSNLVQQETGTSASNTDVDKDREFVRNNEGLDEGFWYQTDSSGLSEVEPLQLATPQSMNSQEEDTDTATKGSNMLHEEEAVKDSNVVHEEAIGECKSVGLQSSTDADSAADNVERSSESGKDREVAGNEEILSSQVGNEEIHNVSQDTSLEIGSMDLDSDTNLLNPVSEDLMLTSNWAALFKDPQAFAEEVSSAKWADKEPETVSEEANVLNTSNSLNEGPSTSAEVRDTVVETHQTVIVYSQTESQEVDIEENSEPSPGMEEMIPSNMILSQADSVMSDVDLEPPIDEGGYAIAHSQSAVMEGDEEEETEVQMETQAESQPCSQIEQPPAATDAHSPPHSSSSMEILTGTQTQEGKGASSSRELLSEPLPTLPQSHSGRPLPEIETSRGIDRGQLSTKFTFNKKDTTGNITIETPFNSLRPFQRQGIKDSQEVVTVSQEILQPSLPTNPPSLLPTTSSTITRPSQQRTHDPLPPHILRIVQKTWFDHALMKSHQPQDPDRIANLRRLGLLDIGCIPEDL